MVEVQKTEVYKVGDKVFASWTEASRYETELQIEETKKNIDKIVSSYKIGTKYLSRYVPFPFLFVKKDKYDIRYYLITSDERAYEIALHILKENNHPEWGFYRNERKMIADAIIETKNGPSALGFLLENSDYEYERFEIDKFEKVVS